MISPAAQEGLQVLRMVAERGLKNALDTEHTHQVDCWQHLLNEHALLCKALEVTTTVTTDGSY